MQCSATVQECSEFAADLPLKLDFLASALAGFHFSTSNPILVVQGSFMSDDENRTGGGSQIGVITRTQPKTKKPSMYKVLLLNDDYTPMEFVVHVLQFYFNKSAQEAELIMLHVHQKGVGVCGVYTYEVAETKVTQVMDFSRKNSHPLQCTMEKE
jgi:ATP-dependent Clp protease adaptor protein ClpS